MTLIGKARKEIKLLGFELFENYEDNFITHSHFIEIVDRDGCWFSIQISGEGFTNEYYPKNIDITNVEDLKNAIVYIKETLNNI